MPTPGTKVVNRVSAVSATFPVTIPVLPNDRWLGVSVHLDTGTVISSVTYAAVAMTEILDQLGGGPGGRPRSAAFAEIAPPVGTANVVITLASNVNQTAVALPWTGVDQTLGFNAEDGAIAKSTTPSIVITSLALDEVVDVMSTRDNGPATAGAGQTVIETGDVGTGGKEMGTSREAGAPSVTMDWTIGSDDWSIVGYNLLEPIPLPADPTGLSVVCSDPFGQIDLAWTDNAVDEDNYQIQRETPIGGGFATIMTIAADSVAFSDFAVLPNTEYNYRVLACKTRGPVCSGPSNEDACTTPAAPDGGGLTDVEGPTGPLTKIIG